jgi:hypothetical protein
MPDRRTTFFLITLLAVMTFIPVLYSGYTTTDDVYFALGFANEGWRSPWVFDARRSGRLQHVFTGQMMPLAYGWGYYWLMKAVAFAAILSNVAALYLVLRRITGDARIGILAATFFFAFIQNTWDHNLLTSYPFILSAALTAFLGAVAAWWTALERAQPDAASPPPGAWSVKRLRAVSVALFTISLLSYESFLPYVVVFPAIAFTLARGTWRERMRGAVRSPHLLALVAVAAGLVLFRIFLYTDQGRAFNKAEQYEFHLSLVGTWKVLERYALSALPMHYFRAYRDLINDFYLGYGTFRTRLFDVFRVLDAAWLMKAAVVAFLVWTVTTSRTVVRHRGFLVFLVVVFMLLTNLPIAVTAKYQAWVIQHFSRAYLTAYFVFFGVVILLAVALDSLVGLAARRHPGWSKALAGLVAAAAFVTCYGSDFINAHVSASQRQGYDKAQAMDAWMASPFFRDMPEKSVVFAPTLWDHYPGATHLFDDYWTRYVSRLGLKRIPTPVCGAGDPGPCIVHVLNDDTRPLVQEAEAAGRLYYMKLVRDPRSDMTYIVVGRLLSFGKGEAFGAREVALITHARSESLRVIGYLHDVGGTCRARVFVDGIPSRGTFDDGLFGVHVNRRRAPEPWGLTELTTSSGLIDPETVMVSESAETVDGAVDVRFGDGFFPDEVAHRWAENEARLTLVNRTNRAMAVELQFEVRAPWMTDGTSHRLQVTAAGHKQDWGLTTAFQKRSVRVDLAAGGAADVAFSTTAPRLNSASDGRNLVLMFLPTIRAQEVGCDEGSPVSRR